MGSTLFAIFFLAFSSHITGTFTKPIDDNDRDDANPMKVGLLQEPRAGRTGKKYYKCYQGDWKDGAESTMGQCVGRFCYRILHQQSNLVKLSCKNFTEEQIDPRSGTCKDMNQGQLPGQSEIVCLCEGNFCNGASTTGFGLFRLVLLILLIAVLLIVSSGGLICCCLC